MYCEEEHVYNQDYLEIVITIVCRNYRLVELYPIFFIKKYSSFNGYIYFLSTKSFPARLNPDFAVDIYCGM